MADGAVEYETRHVRIVFLPETKMPPEELDIIAEEASLPSYPFWVLPLPTNAIRVINMATVAHVDMTRVHPYRPSPQYQQRRLLEQ